MEMMNIFVILIDYKLYTFFKFQFLFDLERKMFDKYLVPLNTSYQNLKYHKDIKCLLQKTISVYTPLLIS